MSTQRKILNIQKIFNPSQYRSNGLATLSKENFNRIMIESVNKALTPDECPVKEKHVRRLLIGSHQSESGMFFWHILPVVRLKENQVICWKFCHLFHKMLRDGHKRVLPDSLEFGRKILLDCGNMWRHVEDIYGQLIFEYCTLLYNRLNFLSRNPNFPPDLKLSDEKLNEIGGDDVSVFFDLSCEIFDSLDDILRLQNTVIAAIDAKKLVSMSNPGKCLLAPLLVCIQDSSLLYDYSVKILFKLHGALPASELEGHRSRFLQLHGYLKHFYAITNVLQYFKTLIQIPQLTNKPPNFHIASDLQQHVTPKVVMIIDETRDSPDSSQLLVNLNEDSRSLDADSEFSTSNVVGSSSLIDSVDTIFNQGDTFHSENSDTSALREKQEELVSKIGELEATIIELNTQIQSQRTDHEQIVQGLRSELSDLKLKYDEQIVEKDVELKEAKAEAKNLRYQMNSLKVLNEKYQEETKQTQRRLEVSEDAMRRVFKDLSDLKNLKQSSVQPVMPDNSANEKLVEELNKKIESLSMKLGDFEDEREKWTQERQVFLSDKVRLEKQLDTQQGDLLMDEMNETDKIIKEATRRIEELKEKSRKLESGLKLQVNEKISEVCSNLMKAVRNLILQSRLLQREVVGDGDDKTNSAEFYKRNSNWTEGLISAANVVAMAARSLVDSADRTMSGKAKFSELAASAHEIAAATTQLVVASRVKAKKDSEKLKGLESAAKQVNQCTSNVVDAARVCGQLIEQESEKEIDISTLSLHQTKKLEMETQVKLLELEDELSKQRIRLGLLRRQHYEQEDAQAAAASLDSSGPR